MDLESECLVLESVEDNEEIKNAPVQDKLENTSESKPQRNGFYAVENYENNELFPEINGNGTEVSGSLNSRFDETKRETSPSPQTAKGYRLKKWRRIRRDASNIRASSLDTGKVESRGLLNSGGNSSKRAQIYVERNQKSEGSSSSTNAVVRNLDGYAFLGDSGVPLGPSFAAGTDSENSEDRSSKSSTAASAPKVKYERPVVVGSAPDKNRMKSSSGKNLTHSAQRGQQVKGRIDTTKKARGEQVKIEKENSYSSMESDSRSSNFVFAQGMYSPSNGLQSEVPIHFDVEIGDEVQGGEQEASERHRGTYSTNGGGGYENISTEDVVADSSWEGKEERSNNHGSTKDQDSLIESISALQSVQEALEKEVLKFKEMSKNLEKELQETSCDKVPSGEGVESFSRTVQSEVAETGYKDVEAELEDLFRQKVEAEVEYLTISRALENLRVAAIDKTQIPDNTKNKDVVILKEEDFTSADEILKLQNRVCKYSSCFFMQLVLLVVILEFFYFELSPNYEEVVPT